MRNAHGLLDGNFRSGLVFYEVSEKACKKTRLQEFSSKEVLANDHEPLTVAYRSYSIWTTQSLTKVTWSSGWSTHVILMGTWGQHNRSSLVWNWSSFSFGCDAPFGSPGEVYHMQLYNCSVGRSRARRIGARWFEGIVGSIIERNRECHEVPTMFGCPWFSGRAWKRPDRRLVAKWNEAQRLVAFVQSYASTSRFVNGSAGDFHSEEGTHWRHPKSSKKWAPFHVFQPPSCPLTSSRLDHIGDSSVLDVRMADPSALKKLLGLWRDDSSENRIQAPADLGRKDTSSQGVSSFCGAV